MNRMSSMKQDCFKAGWVLSEQYFCWRKAARSFQMFMVLAR